jgi:hypothetical protein
MSMRICSWASRVGQPDRAPIQAPQARIPHRCEVIEQLYADLTELLKRPFKGMEKEHQPLPGDAFSSQVRAKYVPSSEEGPDNALNVERETRLELATPTLARAPQAHQISDLGDGILPIDTV